MSNHVDWQKRCTTCFPNLCFGNLKLEGGVIRMFQKIGKGVVTASVEKAIFEHEFKRLKKVDNVLITIQ